MIFEEMCWVHCKDRNLIPKIHKLHGHGKILRAHGGNDGLQFVPALAGHAHGVALDLRGHLELAVADEAVKGSFGTDPFSCLANFFVERHD